MIFPENHICHNSIEIFRRHTQDIFESMGMVVLFFGEILNHDQGYLFYTDLEFFQKRCSLHIPLAGTFLKHGIFPWSETVEPELIQLARSFGYYHPLNIILESGDKKSIYTVAFRAPRHGISSYCLNNLDNLLFNCVDLKRRIEDLIKSGRKQSISIPEHLQNKKFIETSALRSQNQTLQKEAYITYSLQSQGLSSRECETFISLLKFQSSKKISESLRVSPKTVDTYINRIKQKLGLDTRHDIFKFAWDNHFVGYKNYPNL
tara:strand:- start:147362 stop:148147 length:786 start_codon:yes stop_codon:yes gene_type:complete